MKYFIANWKANKTLEESLEWIHEFISELKNRPDLGKKIEQSSCIVICPPFPHLYPLKQALNGFNNVFLGAQDISSFEKGTYTGETTATNLQGLVDYAIIAHSERRKMYHEDEQIFFSKSRLAKQKEIKVCYCIGKNTDKIPEEADFIGWEPPESISCGDGQGNYKPLAEIISFKKQLPALQKKHFLYGGSVNENNVKEYNASKEIEGFIIGGASLDANRFLRLIENS